MTGRQPGARRFTPWGRRDWKAVPQVVHSAVLSQKMDRHTCGSRITVLGTQQSHSLAADKLQIPQHHTNTWCTTRRVRN